MVKLIISLETNGTLTCEQAFDLAVQILTEQFGSLSSTESTQSTKAQKALEEEKDVAKEAERVLSQDVYLFYFFKKNLMIQIFPNNF